MIISKLPLVPDGVGTPTKEAISEAFDAAASLGIVSRPLQYMLRRQAWAGVEIDESGKIVTLGAPTDEMEARESHNARKLREADEKSLRLELKGKPPVETLIALSEAIRELYAKGRLFPLSCAPTPVLELLRTEAVSRGDFHLLPPGCERLNGVYSFRSFTETMTAIRMVALAVARACHLCSFLELEGDAYREDLVALSGCGAAEVKAITEDLSFDFTPDQALENRLLLRVSAGKVGVVPLLIAESTRDTTNYIHLSKRIYPADYARHQEKLTRAFETPVEDALRAMLPDAEVCHLKLPHRHGEKECEIDRIAGDPLATACILVEVKYLLDADNDTIAEGVRQLRTKERSLRPRWDEVTQRVRKWKGRPPPTVVSRLLVTNWFRGTEPRTDETVVLSLDDLRSLEPTTTQDLIQRLPALNAQPAPPTEEQVVRLFGYEFRYRVSRQ
jgi:hypothetical protein